MKPIVLDFESTPIELRPDYPPEPVSFSLLLPGWRKPKFWSWGHKTGKNNCDRATAARVLEEAWGSVSEEHPLLCHNTKFDLDVAGTHFDLRMPDWRRVHDTMFLLFLSDPHARELGLKPASEKLLDLPPEERDAVKDWILAHKKQLEADFPEIVSRYGGIKPSTAGKFIAYAPGDVVEPYCNGDVERTAKLFELLYPEIVDRGMYQAYCRERRLMPILLRNEREGVRVDVKALERDQKVYELAQATADMWLRKALKAPGLDLDNDGNVAAALKKADAVSEWTQTPTGRDSVSKKNLTLDKFRDKKIAAAYVYRQKCATCLETFIRPWQRFVDPHGFMHTNWNQVRGTTGGTRTGRPSSYDPNFFNMPKAVEDNADRGFIQPKHLDVPELPKIRAYILPDRPGYVIVRRDYNQQELRMLGHFEDGALMRAYLENPWLDVHDYLRQMIIELMNLDVGRYVTKTLNFGYIYGQGIPSLAAKMNRSVDEVRGFRDAQMKAIPGLKALADALKAKARRGEPMRTWGGREYYVEPPMIIKGRLQTFEYKLINYLVQGSSADVTKESIIRYDEARQEGRFMLSVYDENNISVDKKAYKREALILRECMMSVETDVPLISDGEWGPTLGDLEDLVEPKPNLWRWQHAIQETC